MRLKDKIVIITGAVCREIGKAVSIRLAKGGADIGVCDIDFGNTKKTAEKIKTPGKRSLAIKTDISKSNDVEKMVSLTREIESSPN